MDAQGSNTSNHPYRNGRLPELTRRTARRHSTQLTHSHQNRRTAVSAERFLERYGENSRERPREAISRAPRIHHHRPSSRHIGVICDGCNIRDFTGIRYRCQVCRDYDLCAACYSQRGQLHELHPFEAIRTPRSQVRRLISDLMSRAANQTVISIIEIGIEEAVEQPTGLDDDAVAWWLANDRQLVDVDRLIAKDPTWTCSICAEGLEVEGENGWVVGICGNSAVAEDPTAVADPPLPSTSSHRPGSHGEAEPTASRPEVTHELVQSDSPCASYHLVPIAAADVPNAMADGLVDGPEVCTDALMVASADAPPASPEAVAGDALADGQAKKCEEKKDGKASSVEGHLFHEGCLRRWLIKKNSCPVCRNSPVIPPPA